MTFPIPRRRVLQGLGHAATLGGLAAALPRSALAAQAAATPVKPCMSMIYPSGEGLSFDKDAYRDRHMALIKRVYGPAVDRIELRVADMPPPPPPVEEGQEAPPPPPQPPVLAAVNLWIASISEFVKRNQAAAAEIAADIATITGSKPMVQFDVLEGEAGGASSSVLGGTRVLSSYFFAKEGGTWDAAYFGKTYPGKLMLAFGGDALQRVEVTRGAQALAGGQLLVTGSIHIYIKDEAAFDAATGGVAVGELGTEAQQYSTLNPVTLVMNVHATG